jgi:hypothetical protein
MTVAAGCGLTVIEGLTGEIGQKRDNFALKGSFKRIWRSGMAAILPLTEASHCLLTPPCSP